jgi:hypothetical protein
MYFTGNPLPRIRFFRTKAKASFTFLTRRNGGVSVLSKPDSEGNSLMNNWVNWILMKLDFVPKKKQAHRFLHEAGGQPVS